MQICLVSSSVSCFYLGTVMKELSPTDFLPARRSRGLCGYGLMVAAMGLVLLRAAFGADVSPVVAGADPDLPQPLDAAALQESLSQSPFTRTVNPAETLQLTGVAFIDGKPVITVKDSLTNKTMVVTDQPNELGWKIAGLAPAAAIQRAEVRIMIGPEIVTLRYSDAQMAVPKRSGYMPSKIPTEAEFTGHDDKGAYVRGMPYLSDADRSKFREVPSEVREKFLNIVHDQRAMLFKASHEERAAFVKRTFDSVIRR